MWYHGRVYVTGSGTIGDLLGDLVAYRSLRPFDRRLAGVQIPSAIPRKVEAGYAHVVERLLRAARHLDAPEVELRRLIVVGDNGPSDGVACDNLCAATGWSGEALIVAESGQPASFTGPETSDAGAHHWSLSHWSQLRDWAAGPGNTGVDETTVVLIDVDKTLLGARGRNDAVIDEARAAAMRGICAEILGERFIPDAFENARQVFNERAYHRLTGDNQDYVAYMSLVAASGAVTVAQLAERIRQGRIATPSDLVAAFDACIGRDAGRLRLIHSTIAGRSASGDPTPFKEFRAREYEETVARMGGKDRSDVETLLRTKIVLTGEVLDVARQWKQQGALLFALSDKPDEAAVPSPELAQQGYQPLHRTSSYIVDSSPSSQDR